MIANQSTSSSPAAAGLASSSSEAPRAPGKTGAASAFAALLGQLYQPPPQVVTVTTPTPVVTAAPESDVAPETDPTAESAVAAAPPTEGGAPGTKAVHDAVELPQPAAPQPAGPVVFTPRAARAVTNAISAGLRSRATSIAGEAKFAALKGAPVNAGGAKRTGELEEDSASATGGPLAPDAQGPGAAVLASVMMQASAAAQAAAQAATQSANQAVNSSDTESPDANGKAASAVPVPSAPGAAANQGGLGAASPMVRAMTLLLDALGVSPDPKDRGAGEPEVKAGRAADATVPQPMADGSHPDATTLPLTANAAMSVALPGADAKGKQDAPVEASPSGKNSLPGAVVSQTPGNDNATPGQGDSRDRHDSRENGHQLRGDAAAAPVDQGGSGWSGTLGGAIGQGMATNDGTEAGRAGATAYVPRHAPTPQPASTSQVTMDLDPTVGMLGKIRVAVRGETVHATITTQDGDATAMGVRAHELRLALEQRGFSDARVTVRSTGTEDAPAAVIASSVTDLKAGATSSSASGRKDSDTQQQPRGDRRDQAGGDRPDTRRQRNRQEQPQ